MGNTMTTMVVGNVLPQTACCASARAASKKFNGVLISSLPQSPVRHPKFAFRAEVSSRFVTADQWSAPAVSVLSEDGNFVFQVKLVAEEVRVEGPTGKLLTVMQQQSTRCWDLLMLTPAYHGQRQHEVRFIQPQQPEEAGVCAPLYATGRAILLSDGCIEYQVLQPDSLGAAAFEPIYILNCEHAGGTWGHVEMYVHTMDGECVAKCRTVPGLGIYNHCNHLEVTADVDVGVIAALLHLVTSQQEQAFPVATSLP